MEKLLFEIGTEEIPAKFMPASLSQLQGLAEKKLSEQRIPYASVQVYGTPRRLTFIAEGVAEKQEDALKEAKGPSVKIAYVNKLPSKAAVGFARSQGVAVEDLLEKDGYVYAVKHIEGQATLELLPALLQDIIHSLTFPKTMRWADHDFRFVRPIRWLVALFGDKIVPLEITGVKSGRISRGHRFLRAPLEKKDVKSFLNSVASKAVNAAATAHSDSYGLVVLSKADDYQRLLRANYVMVDQNERRELIRRQVTELAAAEGGHAEINPDLLEEVTYLVEWPTALCGSFAKGFLALPKECVITPMREHQRYFPVLKEDGSLLNKFITVCNGDDRHLAVVAHGNERVLRARLSDAEFFFKEDRHASLASRLEKLKAVSFQEGLGNMEDKSRRLVKEAQTLAFALNSSVDQGKLERAALLSKCDLVTNMVVEFTELQGVMGREYAKLDGEDPAVAQAVYEHYLPRFAGDELPKTPLGRILSIADKVDNIAATFSRGLAPSGSQDPYALRRQALGIINILIDGNLHLGLAKQLVATLYLLNLPAEKTGTLLPQILGFIKLRLRNLLIDQGLRYDAVDAALADQRADDVADIYARARALNTFVAGEEAPALVQAATRVANLWGKAEGESAINPLLFTQQEERELYAKVQELTPLVMAATVKYQYPQVLRLACGLTQPIDAFFQAVLVMDQDEKVRANRLALLAAVHDLTHAVGELSCLVL